MSSDLTQPLLRRSNICLPGDDWTISHFPASLRLQQQLSAGFCWHVWHKQSTQVDLKRPRTKYIQYLTLCIILSMYSICTLRFDVILGISTESLFSCNLPFAPTPLIVFLIWNFDALCRMDHQKDAIDRSLQDLRLSPIFNFEVLYYDATLHALDKDSMAVLTVPLRWRHNGRVGVSNHQPYDYLLNRLFRRRSKKTSKLRITGLCAGNSPDNRWIPRANGQ